MAVWLAIESWSDYRCGPLTTEVPGVEITFAKRGVPCVRLGRVLAGRDGSSTAVRSLSVRVGQEATPPLRGA